MRTRLKIWTLTVRNIFRCPFPRTLSQVRFGPFKESKRGKSRFSTPHSAKHPERTPDPQVFTVVVIAPLGAALPLLAFFWPGHGLEVVKAIAGRPFAARLYPLVRLFRPPTRAAEKYAREAAAVRLLVDARLLFLWPPLLCPADVLHRPLAVVGVAWVSLVLGPSLLI